jgi:hypothetical protein
VERKDMKNYLIHALGWMLPEAAKAAETVAAD